MYLQILTLCGCLVAAAAIPADKLYPFGDSEGDTRMPPGDDISSQEFQLHTPFAFYNNIHKSLYVNLNGHISFGKSIPLYDSKFTIPSGEQIIAAFLSDVDTRRAGNVYYRETDDEYLRRIATKEINKFFPRHYMFRAQRLFIVTWDQVGHYNHGSDKTNTFQVVLASDGRDTFVNLLYADNGLNWVKGDDKGETVNVKMHAQAGFDAGDNRRSLVLPASGKKEVKNLNGWSNIGRRGEWWFKIGNTGNENVQAPKDPNDREEPERPTNGNGEDENVLKTCHTHGPMMCSINAKCTDYASGLCCKCGPGFIGNGRHCLQSAINQRLSGYVKGYVNGIEIEKANIHSYMVTNDGRVYYAISRIPTPLGISMQSLFVMGSGIGWEFALPTAQAKNGFMFTGGNFNRTVVVKFLAEGQVVKIKDFAKGEEGTDYLTMTSEISGSIPNISPAAKVSIDDYKEDYKRVSPGVIKSFSTKTYRVDGVPYRYTWDQTITFDECTARPASAGDINLFSLGVDRSFISFDDQNQIVRFAMRNKISPVSKTDPCASGNVCGTNSDCIPTGVTYKCQCRDGFSGDGKQCYDIDECAASSPCDTNARCINSVGSFRCQCKSGYRGDGTTCISIGGNEDRRCGSEECDDNARCVFDNDLGRPRCECNSGYTGDGINCAVVEFGCNEVNNCDENAECVFNSESQSYQCECNEGFSGDGQSCSESEASDSCRNCAPEASCQYDVNRLYYRCQCREGYTGDGQTCSRLGDCRVANNCDLNAECVPNHQTRRYECKCNQGYSGDGVTCEASTCDVKKNCHSNARCLFDRETRFYKCQCNPGYLGDGLVCKEEDCRTKKDCDFNAECVPGTTGDKYVCKCKEGYNGDGQVCRSEVIPCNQVNNCDVNADCEYETTVRGYRCSCRPGFTGNGQTCRSTADCRTDSSLCDLNANCIAREQRYACVCRSGFIGDGNRCAPEGETSSYLLYAQGMSIMQAPFKGSKEKGRQVIIAPGHTAVGIDADCYKRYMYWTDVTGHSINRARLDGTESELVINGLGSPEGVSVDWISQNIYWTDSGHKTVEVSKTDGTNKKVLFHSGLVNPRAIAVHPVNSKVYWSDWNREAPKIEVATMDGTNRKTLVSESLSLPNGLTIDFNNEKLFWVDAGTQNIESVNFDGTGRRKIYGLASYPFDITVANDVLYWSDWHMKSIPNMNMNAGSKNDPLDLTIGGNGKLYGIVAVKDQCPRGSNACVLNNGGCRFLCLPTPNGGRTCVCPDTVDEEECNRVGLLLE